MTYSVVARDPVTGELGVAVQSHWFSVGSVVTHARPGLGAVATQSVPEPAHGERILDLLAAGRRPDEALAEVMRGDEAVAYRQTAVVDASGRVAVHTGEGCMAHAGHTTGDGWSCQANIMASPEVWPAMARAFEARGGEPLAERLVATLDAAEEAGGDVRGRQSAALLVVAGSAGAVGGVDLRVEDHPDPLGELRRLLSLHRAYAAASEGDELMAESRFDEAGAAYERAAQLAPGNAELLFWAGLSAAQAGDLEGGVARVREAIARNGGLRTLLDRLGPDVAPSADAVRGAL